MTIIKCDLCGEEIKNNSISMLYADGRLINEWESLKVSIGIRESELDLCSECKRKLYDYMIRSRKDEKKND